MNTIRSITTTALLFTLLPISAVSIAAEKPELTEPVFFSYAWPIGPETVRDFRTLDMEEINVIDIGPDSLSYPRSIRKHYPSEIFDLWHGRGKILVRRCYDRTFGEDGKKIDEVTAAQLIARWSNSMEEAGVDGIAIDEFIRDTPELVSAWIEALRTVRKRYPDKLIFCWIAGKGLRAAELHRAIRDYADYCMPEIYYRESSAKGFPDFAFTRFRDAVDTLERNAPGLAAKTLPGLGVHDKLFNDDTDVDYAEFMEAQFSYIAGDPVLGVLPGLAFYAPMKLTRDHIAVLDGLIRKYYRK